MLRARPGIQLTLLLSLCGCSAPLGTSGTAPDDGADRTGEDPSPQGEIIEPPIRIDDHDISVDETSYAAKRQAVIDFMWGSQGLPEALPVVTKDVPSPVDGLVNLRRVDRLRIDMDGGETNFTEHFIAERSNGHLVILSVGHICKLGDKASLEKNASLDAGVGQYRTLRALLEHGYSVLVTYMPHMSPEACQDVSHNALMKRQVSSGHPIKWFLEPVAVSLNHLKQGSDDVPKYRSYGMVGLSGGGWTTTLYAAIDPTIRTSVSVAGSIPIYLRSGSSLGDLEQTLPELYSIAGYPDLYVLGATGAGRRHVQVLIRKDDCCFGESENQYDANAHGPWDLAMRGVEQKVQQRLTELGTSGGSFRLEIDEAPRHHTISWNTLVATILAEFDGSRRHVAAHSPSKLFVRHEGTLREWSPDGGWVDTTLRAVGPPAVVTTASGTSLFYRSPSNVLTSATRDAAGWSEKSLGRTIISDPVAITGTNGPIVVSIDPTYRPVVSLPDAVIPRHEQVNTGARIAGVPALLHDDDRLTIGARGLDGALHVIEGSIASLGYGPASLEWSDLVVKTPVAGFPAALRDADGSEHVYFRTHDGLLEVARATATGSFRPEQIHPTTNLSGSPTVTVVDGQRRVYARDRSGSLHSFSFGASGWAQTVRRAWVSDSFAEAGGFLFAIDFRGRVVQSDRGGAFLVLGHP